MGASQRQQTVDDVLSTARQLVASGADLSLRAVARERGITAPALYRYFDSFDDLMFALVATLYDELVDAMSKARDQQPAGDLGLRLLASAAAFRAWSMAHRGEFALIFANPVRAPALTYSHLASGEQGAGPVADCAAAGQRFGAFFGELFAGLWPGAPHQTQVPRGIEATALDELCKEKEQVLPGVPPEGVYSFVRMWTRLYGIVTIEVFGHLSWATTDPSPLFTAMLRESAVELGIEDALDRLTAQ